MSTTSGRWQKTFGGLGSSELRQPQPLRAENRERRSLVADLAIARLR